MGRYRPKHCLKRVPNKVNLEVLYYTPYNRFYYFKVTMSVNQDIVRKFEKFSLSLSQCAEKEIEKIKLKLTKDLIGYDQSSFALVIMGSLAKREPSINYDRDSILIFGNDIDENVKSEITKKCISSFDELGIPKCTGGMSIDSEQAVRSLMGWNEFFGRLTKFPRLKQLIFVDAMRSSVLIVGNPHLFKVHQELVAHCILGGASTELLLISSCLMLLSPSKKNIKLILNQIIKYNYIYEPSLLYEMSLPRNLNFLINQGILTNDNVSWLKGYYIRYMSHRTMIKLDEEESISDFFSMLKLRLIALKVLVRVVGRRIVSS